MNIPDEDHYAIITTDSIYVPGDARSKQSPGHGYPEHTVETIHYQAFEDFSEFESRIAYLTRMGANFKAISAKPVTVVTSVRVLL